MSTTDHMQMINNPPKDPDSPKKTVHALRPGAGFVERNSDGKAFEWILTMQKSKEPEVTR